MTFINIYINFSFKFPPLIIIRRRVEAAVGGCGEKQNLFLLQAALGPVELSLNK